MENKYWRWIGISFSIFLAFSVGYGMSYSKGMHDGLKLSIGVGTYLLEQQNITLTIDEEELTNLILAYNTKTQFKRFEMEKTPRSGCEEKNGTYEFSPLDAGYCYFPDGTIKQMNYGGGFL